jgi:hypothetical protein
MILRCNIYDTELKEERKKEQLRTFRNLREN